MPPFVPVALLMLFPLGVIAAALKDATSYIIPNRLCAALALAFAPAALAAGLPLSVFGACLLTGFAALAAGVGLFSFRVLGGGDAKLAAACLLWLGIPAVLPFLLWTGIAGGVLAVGLLAARKLSSSVVVAPFFTAPSEGWVGRLLQPGGDVPYGIAIAFGALAALPSAPIARAIHVF